MPNNVQEILKNVREFLNNVRKFLNNVRKCLDKFLQIVDKCRAVLWTHKDIALIYGIICYILHYSLSHLT